jgi:hypothetical protein
MGGAMHEQRLCRARVWTLVISTILAGCGVAGEGGEEGAVSESALGSDSASRPSALTGGSVAEACAYYAWIESSASVLQEVASSRLAAHFPYVANGTYDLLGETVRVQAIVRDPVLKVATNSTQIITKQGGGANALVFSATVDLRLLPTGWTSKVKAVQGQGTISLPIDAALDGYTLSLSVAEKTVNDVAIALKGTTVDQLVQNALGQPLPGAENLVKAALLAQIQGSEAVKAASSYSLKDAFYLPNMSFYWHAIPWAVMAQKVGAGHRLVAIKSLAADLTACADRPLELKQGEIVNGQHVALRIHPDFVRPYLKQELLKWATGAPQFDKVKSELAQFGFSYMPELTAAVKLTPTGVRLRVFDAAIPGFATVKKFGCILQVAVDGSVWVEMKTGFLAEGHQPTVELKLDPQLSFGKPNTSCKNWFKNLFADGYLTKEKVEQIVQSYMPHVSSQLAAVRVEIEQKIGQALNSIQSDALTLVPTGTALDDKGLWVKGIVFGTTLSTANTTLKDFAQWPKQTFGDLVLYATENPVYTGAYCNPIFSDIPFQSSSCAFLPGKLAAGGAQHVGLNSIYPVYQVAWGANSATPVQALASNDYTVKLVLTGSGGIAGGPAPQYNPPPPSTGVIDSMKEEFLLAPGSIFRVNGGFYLVQRTGTQRQSSGALIPWLRMMRLTWKAPKAPTQVGWETASLVNVQVKPAKTVTEAFAAEGSSAPPSWKTSTTSYQVSADLALESSPVWDFHLVYWKLDGVYLDIYDKGGITLTINSGTEAKVHKLEAEINWYSASGPIYVQTVGKTFLVPGK